MVRPLVSYDDISSPQEKTENSPTAQPASRQKSSKKRKRSAQTPQHHHHRDWDDNPESRRAEVSYNEDIAETSITMNEEEAEQEDGEESRELTHEEIWDDSALIDAWNAATAEYNAYHGDPKGWKKEPTVKSPLWYNVPPSKTKRQVIPRPHIQSGKEIAVTENKENNTNDGDAEENSRPSDFDTFVPSHDPSLRHALPESSHALIPVSHSTPPSIVNKEEAFNRALEAMYWSGYWTAAYHYAKSLSSTSNGADDTMNENSSQGDYDPTDG